MGTVYHAFDPRSGRDVAIKVLPREMMHDPQFRSRFENEIKLVTNLEHSAIVPVYDVGEEDGQPYFVMRYMPGGSLAQRIAKGRLPLAEVARVVGRIAPALDYAHKKGVIHRDLKPDNILFDADNEPFISDFGIAKILGGGTGSLTGKDYVGTPAYMSPEQAQGEKMDPRSDVYSLGAVIYEALSGEPPYQAENPIGVAIRHVMQPVPEILKIAPDLPEDVDVVVKTAMAKEKNQRYSSPLELAKALNAAAFGGASSSLRGGRWKAGLAAAGLAVLILALGAYLLRRQLFASAPATAVLQTAPATAVLQQPARPVPSASPAPTATLAFTPSPSPTPTATLTFTPAVLPFAPDCPAAAPPPTPVVNWLDSFCVEKVPYTTVSIPEGATFESLNPDFSCKAEITRKGKTTLSCLGIPSYSFNLKVCNPPAVLAPSDSAQCPPDKSYDAANQCCAAPLSPDASCVIFKVDIRSCP